MDIPNRPKSIRTEDLHADLRHAPSGLEEVMQMITFSGRNPGVIGWLVGS
jgi:hypothetical protein